MVQIQSQDTINNFRLVGRIPNSEEAPKELGKTIVPVIVGNQKFSSWIAGNSAVVTGSSSTGFPTVSSGSEIYITSFSVSLIKDATCDQATGVVSLVVTPDISGIATNLLSIPIITLTAQSHDFSMNLPYPLKIKAGSAGTFTASYTLGTMVRAVRYTGFIIS